MEAPHGIDARAAQKVQDMKDEAAKANYQLSEFPPTLSSAKTSYQTTGILCELRPPDLHSGD